MRNYIIKRVAQSVLILFCVMFIIYALIRSLPSSFAETMAMQLAQALNGSKDEGAQALSNTLASNAEKAIARKITVGGKGAGLGGITSSQTIATVSNGSNSELAPPPAESAGK